MNEAGALTLAIGAGLLVFVALILRPDPARGFHWLLLAATALAGAILGGLDFGLIGAGAGALVGLVAASLVGGVLYFVAGLPSTRNPPAWCGRLLAIVFLGVLAYDLYWWSHVFVNTSISRASADLQNAAIGKIESLRDHRRAHHGRLSTFQSRPARWFIRSEARARSRAALDLVEPLLDRSAEVPEQERAALRARSDRLWDASQGAAQRHAEKTLVLQWLQKGIEKLAKAWERSDDEPPPAKPDTPDTPSGRALVDAVREAIGNATVTHEDRWDDGSGGEAELAVVLSGPNLYRLTRDADAGWRLTGSMDASSLHLASNRRFDPHFVAITLHGKGCMVGHKTPGTPSWSVVTLEGDQPRLANQLGDRGAATTRDLGRKLVAWSKQAYPELDPDWIEQATLRMAEEFCK